MTYPNGGTPPSTTVKALAGEFHGGVARLGHTGRNILPYVLLAIVLVLSGAFAVWAANR